MSDLIKDIANLSPQKRELLLQRLRQKRENVSQTQIKPQSRNSSAFPLSFAQQRLWFLDRFEPENPFYNQSAAMRMIGVLNLATLERSFNEIVRRHEVFRTTFTLVEGQPAQVIAPNLTLTLPVVDLQELPDAEGEVLRLSTEEAQRSFNLAEGPLLRCTLLRLEETEHVLLCTMHHIISDAWSKGILIRELATLYKAFASGNSSSLPELPIQYADFAVWQRQWLSEGILRNQLHYWQQQLQDVPDLLQLPTDHPRPNIQTYRGATQSFSLNTELTKKLKTLSRKSGTTSFMTLLAAFATLLYRYSSQEDILIGSPIANRNRREIESLMGFFLNTLVLRTRFENNLSFESLLAQVRKTTLKAYENQDAPFEQVIEILQPQRSLSHSPLFQVMFILHNAPMGEIELPGVTLTQSEQESTTAKFDLTLSITETAQGLVGAWEYNTDLFNGSTIQRMTAHFQNLLSAVVENPQLSVAELPLLSEAERHQLLVQWNDTESKYPSDKCIHQLFEEQVEKTPDAVAVVFEKEQLTYQQLNQRANQLAHHLQSLGVKAEVLVGICVERSLEMVVGLLGILKAGGAYVPLDPNYPRERLSYILADSGVEVLLTQSSLLESLPEHQAQVVSLDTAWGAIEQHSQESLDAGVSSDNLAYVIYTSGSTGQPKGIAMNHAPLVNLILWQLKKSSANYGTKTGQFTPISFDVSFQEILSTWCSGGTLVLIPEDVRRDGTALLQLLAQQGVERLFLPFVALEQLAQSAFNKQLLPSKLCELITAGEQLQITPTLVNFLDKLSNCRLENQYGPTETHVVTAFTLKGFPNNWSSLPPIGRPIANTQIYILDNHLQPVPIGVSGELYIGGNGLARGYLNRPELTSEKFIPNPFSDAKSERLYKTGDIVRYLSDGNIEFLGRIDHQVKIRGFRIELGEIEAVLNTHLQIQQAVVIAREDPPGNKRLVAYIVTRDESLTTNQLREFLLSKLPEYMVTKAFVTLDTLPLTPNGKIDRKALPAPDGEIIREHEYVAPRTASEEIIANIFASVLGVQNVGIHDNFFEIGGHSLLMVKVHSQLSEQFNIDLSLIDLFRYPTISSLVEYLSRVKKESSLVYTTDIETEKISAGKAQQRKRRQKMKSI